MLLNAITSTAALILLVSQGASAATIKQWIDQHATTPYSDEHTKSPLTFATASRVLASKSYTRGTLFVPADDVYSAAGASTGGLSFIPGEDIDFSINIGSTPDGPTGKFHYNFFVDADNQVSFVWDDYAPGRPLSAGQKWGPGSDERSIYLFSGNEVAFSQCYVTAAVKCDDGMIQAVSCLINPNPDLVGSIANRKRMGLAFESWERIIETAGMTQALNNAPFNSITVFYPNNAAVAAAGLPGSYSPEDLAKIVGFNVAIDGAYASSASPGIFSSTLFTPSSGQRANDISATYSGAGDVAFFGGIIRGQTRVAMPPSLQGTLGAVPGGGQPPSIPSAGQPTTSAGSATESAATTTTAGVSVTNAVSVSTASPASPTGTTATTSSRSGALAGVGTSSLVAGVCVAVGIALLHV
ncbi:hypothetical protein HDU67_007386 [Dinochytrium kinnereticum]|nr:hypothetical protein HDU67_007386 [Dinochytrium kinnereticum]